MYILAFYFLSKFLIRFFMIENYDKKRFFSSSIYFFSYITVQYRMCIVAQPFDI